MKMMKIIINLKGVRNVFKGDNGDYNYRVYESKGSQYYESLEEYLSKLNPTWKI